ncbi:MAG: tripartite tricarboxylate transporter substrate binding protein [Pseudomonadota bacterium]|nr:tripartite tricarboxylate transporter substrate binding protein [Pseudomonadota bacterium]
MNIRFKSLTVAAFAGAALYALPAVAQTGAQTAAQSYPSQPLRLIVPFPPGGPTDVLGRVLGQGLGEAWHQPVVVDNKAGAAGNIGVDAIAKATPDGSVFGVVPAGNIAVNPTLFKTLPYKAADLLPVAMLATVENVLVVNPQVGVTNLKELLALAAAKPGQLSFASPGAGSQAHLAGELLQLGTGVKLLHVPYKGTGPALNDLLGGQVTMMFAQLSSALPYIKAGKLVAIGIASPVRTALLPNVPTIAEQGVPKFEAVSWYALMAPAGTPVAIIDKLNAETNTVLQRHETKEKLGALGLQIAGGTAAQLAATIDSETRRWAEVIRKQNIKTE